MESERSFRSGATANQELLQKTGKVGPCQRPTLTPFLLPAWAAELPVLGGDVHALQGAQKLVVAQPQVLEAWWRASAQTLHAGDVVAIELQNLQGGKAPVSPALLSTPSSRPEHSPPVHPVLPP